MNRIKRFLVNNCSQFITEKYRNKFYRIFGMNFGKGTIIRKKCFFDQDRILIGDNCFINRNCQFHMGGGTEGKITIGNNVRFGMDVELICVSHKIGGGNKRAGEDTYKPIVIGDGCWIGARTTILQGVCGKWCCNSCRFGCD